MNKPTLYRGHLYHCLSYDEAEYLRDGALAVDETGQITGFGAWESLHKNPAFASYQTIPLGDNRLMIPGLIDMHVHLPQMEARGLQAETLLDWLEQHIFATEAKFVDATHARKISAWFFDELLRYGTTTAAVFLTSHTKAADIAFEEAEKRGNRVIMGLNLMDRNSLPALVRPTADMLADTEALCKRWHGVDNNRLMYAWMPRFAITSTEELLAGIGKLRTQYPDVHFHTHLSEQVPELERVKKQFPWSENYTHVYDKFGMLAPKSILAHGIHLSDAELDRIDETGCGLAHCPSSNFFLKSGRFPWLKIADRGSRFGLGSDVGAGPSLNMFEVMRDAQYTQETKTIPLNALMYAATLGAARAMHLDDRIGNFAVGKEADFTVLEFDGAFHRLKEGAEAALSSAMYVAGAVCVAATAVRGRVLFEKAGVTLQPSALLAR